MVGFTRNNPWHNSSRASDLLGKPFQKKPRREWGKWARDVEDAEQGPDFKWCFCSHLIPREARYVHYSSEFVSELLYSSAQNHCLWASLWGCNNLCALLALWASAEQTLRSLKLSKESPRCEVLDQKQSDMEDGHPEPEQSILLGTASSWEIWLPRKSAHSLKADVDLHPNFTFETCNQVLLGFGSLLHEMETLSSWGRSRNSRYFSWRIILMTIIDRYSMLHACVLTQSVTDSTTPWL